MINKSAAIKKLEEVFREVFENEDIILTPDTSNNDIDGWTSLTHAVLIDNIEKQFNISFEIEDMLTMHNVADIINKIEEKSN